MAEEEVEGVAAEEEEERAKGPTYVDREPIRDVAGVLEWVEGNGELLSMNYYKLMLEELSELIMRE